MGEIALGNIAALINESKFASTHLIEIINGTVKNE